MTEKCSHSELAARFVALESAFVAFKELMSERDVRYSQRALSQDNAVKNALETSEKAIIKAEDATEKRFASVNEFRQTLADQANLLMPRAEYTVQHQALVDKVQNTEERLNEIQKEYFGTQARGVGVREGWGYIVAAGSAIVAAAAIYFNHH